MVYALSRLAASVALGIVLIWGPAACAPRSVSGVYLASNENSISMLQLVENENGGVSGSIQSLTMDTQGIVRSNTIQLLGSIDGKALSLTDVVPVLHSTTPISGEFAGDAVSLTIVHDGEVTTYTYGRANTAVFTQESERLQERGQQLRNELQIRAETARFRASIPSLIAELEQTASNNQDTKPKLEQMTAQYPALTESATALAHRNDDYGLGLIEIQQHMFRLHLEVRALQDQFQSHRESLFSRASSATAWCQHTADPICQRLPTALERYRVRSTLLQEALTREDTIYEREAARQEQLQAAE